jgi:tetratricopeptide (TPR) repeat protein
MPPWEIWKGAPPLSSPSIVEAPDNAGVNYGMGYVLYQQKEYQTAAGYFKRAIQLDPDMAEAWNNRAAIFHFVERDYQKARQYYEKAIVLGKRTHNQRVVDIAKKNLAHLPKEEKITPVTENTYPGGLFK